MRRALVGGTFDPPHLAHMVVGEAVYRQGGVDVVTFIPAGAPWQKSGREVSSPDDRWEMVNRSVADVDYFEADDREVRRHGPTFTIDTLDTFGDDDVVLVLGADAAARLPTWHRWRDVLDRATLAVAPRPGTPKSAVEGAVSGVLWLNTPELPVSGTAIRRHVAAGGSARFLVRDPVWAYIEQRGLYRASPVESTPDATGGE